MQQGIVFSQFSQCVHDIHSCNWWHTQLTHHFGTQCVILWHRSQSMEQWHTMILGIPLLLLLRTVCGLSCFCIYYHPKRQPLQPHCHSAAREVGHTLHNASCIYIPQLVNQNIHIFLHRGKDAAVNFPHKQKGCLPPWEEVCHKLSRDRPSMTST